MWRSIFPSCRSLRKFVGLLAILILLRLSFLAIGWNYHSEVNYEKTKQITTNTQPPDKEITSYSHDYPRHYGRKNSSESKQETFQDLKLLSTRCAQTERPPKLRFRNDVWHMYQNSTQEIHIYSAFYDDRPDIGVLPYMRLLAVATPSDKPMYCQLWYDGIPNPVSTLIKAKASGRGDKIRGIKYNQELYSCQLQYSNPVPTHVSVSTSECGQSTILVPVEVPLRGQWKHEFGVCVAIAFGSVPWHQFIEWLELTRLLGVAEFNIYNGSMSTSMRPLFDYYEKHGIVNLHQMPPPQFDYSKWGTKLGSPASLNDCMLRYMYRYKYIIVVDFDEIVLPGKDENYHLMLERIDKEQKFSESWLSYTFRNIYHFSDIPASSGPKYTTIMRYRKRTKDPSAYLFAPKSFIDPRRCISVFNHYCYIRFPNSPKKWTVDVSPEIGMSHHFRSCIFKEKCAKMIEESVDDLSFLKYNETLVSRMQNVFTDLSYVP